jgi:hypothetical protein
LFEVEVGTLQGDAHKMDHDTMTTFKKLESNYGKAGEVYAAWLAANRQHVEDTVGAVQRQISDKLNASNEERFRIGTVTALFCGAEFAKQLGLINFDMPKLGAYLESEVLASRRTQAQYSTVSYESTFDLLEEYIQSNRGGFATYADDVMTARGAAAGLLAPETTVAHEHTTVRGWVTPRWVIVSEKLFKSWLLHEKQQANWTSIKDKLLREDNATEKRFRLDKDAKGAQTNTPVRCLAVPRPDSTPIDTAGKEFRIS